MSFKAARRRRREKILDSSPDDERKDIGVALVVFVWLMWVFFGS